MGVEGLGGSGREAPDRTPSRCLVASVIGGSRLPCTGGGVCRPGSFQAGGPARLPSPSLSWPGGCLRARPDEQRQVPGEDGVSRAAGARRRFLPGRVWRSSRRTSLPWTSSGSFVWLFCYSSRAAFNLETCRLMISMLDRDMSGTLGFNEFKELWAVVNGWKQHFLSFDNDRSGTVDRQELEKALMNMGFRLSPQAVTAITKRYSTQGKITFDDYIACCVKLRALTECFRRRDASQQGFVNFQYDDFIQCVMSI
ncbi:sorcin isoform X1 [Colius striatus]|uniref:sorcin isoform X1 n=2 Tax=Colius striatus TaxID=57412 RepID=UPI002B1D5781|nr:sorcin isoform X1 [Colius striatus]